MLEAATEYLFNCKNVLETGTKWSQRIGLDIDRGFSYHETAINIGVARL